MRQSQTTSMAASSVLVVVVLLMSAVQIHCKEFIRMCYFPSWTREGVSTHARFSMEYIDPSLCTHIIYAFANIDKDSHLLVPGGMYDEDSPGRVGMYKQFNALKSRYSHLRTLLSVGGEIAGVETFTSVTRDDSLIAKFAKNAVTFVRKAGFDGLDIDWEFPDNNTNTQFAKLLEKLREEFNNDNTGSKKLLLTAALPAGKTKIDDGIDVNALNMYLDYANLMTYDYFGGWSDVTGFNSPLYSRTSDKTFDPTFSTNWTVNYYKEKGLALEKILVGVTAAGVRFKLANSTNTKVGAPVIKPGEKTPRISDLWRLENRYAYPEICRMLESTVAVRVFDKEQQVPYVVLKDEWVGYEDVESVKGKVEYMLKTGVGGAMFWAFDMDDFTGKVCSEGVPYPLLRALSHSVSTLGGPTLTQHVNPNIRYLNEAGSAGRVHSSGFLLTVALTTVGGYLFVLFTRRE